MEKAVSNFQQFLFGFWHNFGSKDNYDNMKAMCRKAFDLGITQFDLANNYGLYTAAQRKIQAGFRAKISALTVMNLLSLQKPDTICGLRR